MNNVLKSKIRCITSQKAKRDFPLLSRNINDNPVIYLDNAATTLKPRSVLKAMDDYYCNVSANIHRGKHILSEEASDHYEYARSYLADFIGCKSNELIFTKNTTESLNLIALGIGLTKEDNVVVCLDSHLSNILPWKQAANIFITKIDDNGMIDLNHFRDLMKNHPKIVALTYRSNVTGIYHPLKEVIEIAKTFSAVVVIDAAQSIPHRRINVNQLDIDFLAFSGHKMLGPTGIGILYGKMDLLKRMKINYWGGGMIDAIDGNTIVPRRLPYCFEAGTPNISGAYGMIQAIKYLNEIGYDYIEEHDIELGRYIILQALSREYLDVIIPNFNIDRGSTVSFVIKGELMLDEIARILSDSYGLMCRTGHLCSQPYVDFVTRGEVLRISGYIYNSKDDIDYFFNSLDEIINILNHQI